MRLDEFDEAKAKGIIWTDIQAREAMLRTLLEIAEQQRKTNQLLELLHARMVPPAQPPPQEHHEKKK